MAERAEVEKYKLGKQETQFLKRFRDVLRAEALLQAIGQEASDDMTRIMELFNQIKGAKEQLLQIPPMVQEIPGQESPQSGGMGMGATPMQQNPPENMITPDLKDKWQINY
jgi:hypothetical protein